MKLEIVLIALSAVMMSCATTREAHQQESFNSEYVNDECGGVPGIRAADIDCQRTRADIRHAFNISREDARRIHNGMLNIVHGMMEGYETLVNQKSSRKFKERVIRTMIDSLFTGSFIRVRMFGPSIQKAATPIYAGFLHNVALLGERPCSDCRISFDRVVTFSPIRVDDAIAYSYCEVTQEVHSGSRSELRTWHVMLHYSWIGSECVIRIADILALPQNENVPVSGE